MHAQYSTIPYGIRICKKQILILSSICGFFFKKNQKGEEDVATEHNCSSSGSSLTKIVEQRVITNKVQYIHYRLIL